MVNDFLVTSVDRQATEIDFGLLSVQRAERGSDFSVCLLHLWANPIDLVALHRLTGPAHFLLISVH